MDAINLDILKQLQEYAQMYFNAIVETNTTCGKCKFADGQYTAKDVMKWNYRQPEEDLYDEDVTLQSGTFKCKFPYRRIFEVLNDWESMSRAGKLKTVFEIGETETKSAKVLIQEKTALGAFKFKSMKLQRIAGNWWRPTKLPKHGQVWLYHETNGVMHIGGRQVFASELEDCPERIEAFCEKWNDEEFIKLMSKYNPDEDSEFNGYYTKVLELAGISNEPEQPATATETAKTENEPQEETNESVKHISEIIETCRLYDDNGKETDEWRYYNWLRDAHTVGYKNIAENALAEALAWIFEAAYRKGHGHITAMNKNGILIETIITAIQPPQSPGIPETAYHTTGPEKRVTEPRIKPRRTVIVLLAYPQKRVARNLPQCANYSTVNHIRGTTKMTYIPPEYSPPIRGDCTMRTNRQTTYFKPP